MCAGAGIFAVCLTGIGRVVQHAQGSDGLLQVGFEKVFLEPEVNADAAVNQSPKAQAGIKIAQDLFTPAVDWRPEIDTTKRLAGEHFRVVFGEVGTDVEGFLHVGAGFGVELLISHGHIATVVR